MTHGPTPIRKIPALRPLATGLFALLITACQAGWVTLDGRRAEADALRVAGSACRLEQRLAELEAAEVERARRLREATSNAGTMLAREAFDTRTREIRAALEDCMRNQGFRPG